MRSKIFTRTVGYWPLQESSGQAYDYSGNENHASTANVSSYGVSGPVGSSAMDFDGTDDEIVVDSALPSGDRLTLAAWWRYEGSDSSRHSVVGYFENINLKVDDSDDNLEVHVQTDAEGWSNTQQPVSGLKNTWNFAVVRYDGNTVELYNNGRKIGSFSKTGNLNQPASSMKIGRRADNTEPFNGKIAHVRIWDYPLPEASIRALYNASRGGFGQSDSKTI
ncbi:LamG domain-containing protein [Candidatus Nanosalina sp. VS9-1]|uniref:LamG domain-containing protein n=1 Tax=Candidatus Nanosalina sp. VS9-1 TaxID=3388566 RepID=UPI0039E04818